MPSLLIAAAEKLQEQPIHLQRAHAETLLSQFQETARFREWHLFAVAVMFNHFRIVIGVPGDPDPAKILGDFKSWGTRKLSATFGSPASQTWWTERGSKRKLLKEEAVLGAVRYVLFEQPNPLITVSPETGICFGIPERRFQHGERRGVSPTCSLFER